MSRVSEFLNKRSARRSANRAAQKPGAGFAIEPMKGRGPMSVGAAFSKASSVLAVMCDSQDNSIVISREASGNILINVGAVSITGGRPTVANTSLIQAFGQAGNNTISLGEVNGMLPDVNPFGGENDDILIGGSGSDELFGQAGNNILIL